jgi:hypothetical protein
VNDGRNESPDQRYDRNMNELLQELRVALPGVQVLFAFLLTVPFAAGWDRVNEFQTHVYFVTLLCSAIASAFFIAPTAYHRLNFRKRDKRHIVEVASRFAVMGLVALSLAMVGAVVLVTDVIFGSDSVWIAGVGVAVLFAALWFAMPLLRRTRNGHGGDASGEEDDREARLTSRPRAHV